MMTNLFSIFDPSSAYFSFSWLILVFNLLFLPSLLWKTSSILQVITTKSIYTFKKEISYTMKSSEKGSQLMIMTVFVSILLMNILALYPYTFSPTSHLAINLPLSLGFWLALMLFGWLKNVNHMLSHLVPQGTPVALMVFMVLIELVSNMIRPITLCVRLTANLIAGHLLMTLLGNSFMLLSILSVWIFFLAPLILTILEAAVACIQAYVFMTLVTLYLTELKYW